jgi:hypothetical protein
LTALQLQSMKCKLRIGAWPLYPASGRIDSQEIEMKCFSRYLLATMYMCLVFCASLPAQPAGITQRTHSSRTVHARSYTPRSTTRFRNYHTRTSVRRTARIRSSYPRVKRSAAAKDRFMRENGYSHGRKGYVVDHVVPLACGGADSPSNMQWQTAAEAKAKDKTERRGCR